MDHYTRYRRLDWHPNSPLLLADLVQVASYPGRPGGYNRLFSFPKDHGLQGGSVETSYRGTAGSRTTAQKSAAPTARRVPRPGDPGSIRALTPRFFARRLSSFHPPPVLSVQCGREGAPLRQVRLARITCFG